MSNTTKLTQEELDAIKAFAQANPRNWKSELRRLWERAAAGELLQSVRNKIGPSGLAGFVGGNARKRAAK